MARTLGAIAAAATFFSRRDSEHLSRETLVPMAGLFRSRNQEISNKEGSGYDVAFQPRGPEIRAGARARKAPLRRAVP